MPNQLYRPLTSPRAIRLLKIEDAVGSHYDPPMRCQLEEVDIEEAQKREFTAISYNWGDPIWRPEGQQSSEARAYRDPEFEIEVNGQPFLVRRNLYILLFRYRCFTDAENIWIDALCINQNDVNERNAQVSMMSDIYHKADVVFIWLGPNDQDSTVALRLIEALGRSLDQKLDKSDCPVFPFLTGLAVRGPEPVFNSQHIFDFLELSPFTAHQWKAIGRFLQRPWFNRVWTMQEDCLASTAIFYCGVESCRYTYLRTFVKLVSTLGWSKPLRRIAGTPGVSSAISLIPQASLMRIKDPKSFEWALKETERYYGKCSGNALVAAFAGWAVENCRTRRASDLRDKIFAPCALATFFESQVAGFQVKRTTPLPDYNQNVNQIFVDFTLYVISSTRNLSLLTQAERGDPSEQSGRDLPSWVPDFAVSATRESSSLNRRYYVPAGQPTQIKDMSWWNVCPLEPFADTVEPIGRDKIFLRVRGYHLTNVVTTASADCQYAPDFDYMALLQLAQATFHNRPHVDWLEQLAKTMACCKEDEDPPKWVDAFQHTLAVNIIQSQPVKKSFHQQTQLYINKIDQMCSSSPLCPNSERLKQDIIDMQQAAVTNNDGKDPTSWESERLRGLDAWMQQAKYYTQAQELHCKYRKLISTALGGLGLGPRTCEAGDEVWLLPGLRAPVVLRRGSGETRIVVGEAYVHGYMLGEAFEEGILKVGMSSMIVLK